MSAHQTDAAADPAATAVRLVPETRDRSAGRPDVTGAVLLAGALVAVAYPLLEGRSLGWPAWAWLLLAAGLVMLAGLGLIEERRQHTRVAPLLRTRLFRIPAFTAGLFVMLAFSAGAQGFFLVLAVWIQTGMGYSPLAAGLTALAFSAGTFLLAPVAVPLAQRYGRYVLCGGGLLLAAGIIAVRLGAGHVGTGSDPWPRSTAKSEISLDRDHRRRNVCISALHVDVARRVHRRSG